MYSIFWIFLAFAWLPCSKLAPLTSFRVAWHARKTWSHPNSVKDVGSWCDFVLHLSVLLDDEKYLLLVWEYRYIPVYSKMHLNTKKYVYIYIIYDVILSSIQRWLLISRGGVRCKQNKNEAIMRYRVMEKTWKGQNPIFQPNWEIIWLVILHRSSWTACVLLNQWRCLTSLESNAQGDTTCLR